MLLIITGRFGELYHIKAAGQQNWSKIDALLAKIEDARKSGLKITANMYTYPAAGTGLDACLPPWTQDGGYPALFKRLRDPATREKIAAEVRTPSDKWENLYLAAGSPDKILLSGFKTEKLKPLTGKSLAEVAKMRGKDPIETIMDLISEDESRIDTIYFLMSEENLKKQMGKPWVSFGSDEASQAPEGNFLKSNCHPRAYGNFARVLGKYVREEKVLTIEEAIRKMTSLPATNLGLDHRGFVQEGMLPRLGIRPRRAPTRPSKNASVGRVKKTFRERNAVRKTASTRRPPGRAVWGPVKFKYVARAAPRSILKTTALRQDGLAPRSGDPSDVPCVSLGINVLRNLFRVHPR